MGQSPSWLWPRGELLASRRILFTACSEHPGGAWATQQARNLAWQLQEAEEIKPRFLIHDRHANFPAAFDAVFRAEGLEVIRTPVRAPNAHLLNGLWWTARRECLDHLLIVGVRPVCHFLRDHGPILEGGHDLSVGSGRRSHWKRLLYHRAGTG